MKQAYLLNRKPKNKQPIGNSKYHKSMLFLYAGIDAADKLCIQAQPCA